MKEALRIQALASSLLFAAAVTSCKTKETPSTLSPPASSRPASAEPTAKVEATAKADPTDDACAFFTKDIAQQALGVEVEGPEHIALTHVEHQRDDCRWHAAGNPTARVTGTIGKHAYSREQFVSDTKSVDPKAEVLSGIAEAALLIGQGRTRQAVAFTPAYTVNVLGAVPDEQLKRALIQLVARLPK